jgi:mono/diheme cytochrome c family protein
MTARLDSDEPWLGWRGIGLIASTYVYFLLFAQFGFLKRLTEAGFTGQDLNVVLGAMALSGVSVSLLVFRFADWEPSARLRAGFAGCAAGALLALVPLNLCRAMAVAGMIGGSLGLLTVTLVTHLESWIGPKQPLLEVGCGVGLAYFVCNIPPLFAASPTAMALCSAALCLIALGLPTRARARSEGCIASERFGIAPAYLLVLACFTGLIWLDSAAFSIIQNTASLKAGTWEGTRRLWHNGGLHLLGAASAAPLLRRYGLLATLAIAFTFLGTACLSLLNPVQASLTGWLYPVGVSLYSVALVAYPSFLSPAESCRGKAWRAGCLYAVAGWIGSTLGIGMGENLRHVPVGFVLGAAPIAFVPAFGPLVRRRLREVLVVGGVLAGAGVLHHLLSPATAATGGQASASLSARGRQVYISEGCLHCHSQYVRPATPDPSMWGKPTDPASLRSERPPLIGNRRQGPDLANVGCRRSPLWLRAHFMEPSQVSRGSVMPSYQYLFEDDRGEALVAYVASLGAANRLASLLAQGSWHLPRSALVQGQKLDGAALFTRHCATCHTPGGATCRTWHAQFKRIPPDLAAGPFIYVPPAASAAWRLGQIAKIIKFGLPGTDMPGHEYLPDEQIAALAGHVIALSRSKR